MLGKCTGRDARIDPADPSTMCITSELARHTNAGKKALSMKFKRTKCRETKLVITIYQQRPLFLGQHGICYTQLWLGRIFSQSGNELVPSSFSAWQKILPLYFFQEGKEIFMFSFKIRFSYTKRSSFFTYLHCAEHEKVVADLLSDLIHVATNKCDITFPQIRTRSGHIMFILEK